MGLTIYYNLTLPGDEPEARAYSIVQRLRDAAVTLAAQQITPVRRIVSDDCEGLERQELDLDWLVRCFAARVVEDPRDSRRTLTIPPSVAYGFGAVLGQCEPVILGLGRYPQTADDAGTALLNQPKGWCWHACTKTQYASLNGTDHFVSCHRNLVALLDAARTLGLEVDVRDDSGYWDHRDERLLVESVEYWNAIVAQIAGRVADAAELVGHEVDAPVFRHPEFERLEMKPERSGGTGYPDQPM